MTQSKANALYQKLNIPPVFVDAETLPEQRFFKERPAEYIIVGDIVKLRGQEWRVKDARRSKTSPRITFTLWPVAGGRPETQSFFPRQWLPIVKGVTE